MNTLILKQHSHTEIQDTILQYFQSYFQIVNKSQGQEQTLVIPELQQIKDYLNTWGSSRKRIENIDVTRLDNIDQIIDDYKNCQQGILMLQQFVKQKGNKIAPTLCFVWNSCFIQKMQIKTQDILFEYLCHNYNLAILYIQKVRNLTKGQNIDFLVTLNIELGQQSNDIIQSLELALAYIEIAIDAFVNLDPQLQNNLPSSFLESIKTYICANLLQFQIVIKQNELKKPELISLHLSTSQKYQDSSNNLQTTILQTKTNNKDLQQSRVFLEQLGKIHLQQACYLQALVYDPKMSTSNNTKGLMGKALSMLKHSNELSKQINLTNFNQHLKFVEMSQQLQIQIQQIYEDYHKRNEQIYKDPEVSFNNTFFVQNEYTELKFQQQVENIIIIQVIQNQENIFVKYVEEKPDPPINLLVNSIFIAPGNRQVDFQKVQEAFMISEMDKNLRKSALEENKEDEVVEQQINFDNLTCSVYVNKKTNLQQIEQNTHSDPKLNIQMETQRLVNSILSNVTKLEESKTQLKTMSGMLLKKSPHVLQGYQERYCELKNKILKYYRLRDRLKPFGILNFEFQTYQIVVDKNTKGQITQFIIRPEKSQKLFIFKGPTPEINQDWVTAILENYQQSRGFHTTLTGLTNYHRFWRNDIVTATQFENEVNTGDIILFRGKDINCQLQRSLTGAEFDHVGMLLKYNNTIYIFEATGSFGVGLCPWDSMMSQKWYQLFDKIVYRKLNHKRGAMFITTLTDFVADNVGKKFSCSLKKLMQNKSTILLKETKKIDQFKVIIWLNSKDQPKARTFFCSELVAKTYKTLGILPEIPASSKYWPNNFTSKSKPPLEMLDGAYLSSEYLIDFS